MKILKIAGIVIAVIALIVIVLGLVGAKTYNVHREIVINAPAETVYKTASHYENFPQWSPWQHLDPNMKTNIEGTDGTVGAKYSWVGNNKAGAGAMTLTKLEENKTIGQDLDFEKPFKSHATTYMNFEPADGGTKVTWGMMGESGFVSRVMMTLMGGMDKMIGPDYEKGLANLKSLTEAEASSAPAYEIKEVDWAEKNYLTKREVVKFQDMSNFFGNHFPKMDEAIGKAGAKPGIMSGVYYKYDEQAMTADVAAAVPYEGKKVSAKGYDNLTIPAGKAYMVDYYGDYMKMKPAYDAIDAKLKTMGKENPDLVVEEYITDPMSEADTAKWNTKIYFFVK
jgi:effector-binding domain-containing protein/uncharacterized protein YndB with AHSA1/START domain